MAWHHCTTAYPQTKHIIGSSKSPSRTNRSIRSTRVITLQSPGQGPPSKVSFTAGRRKVSFTHMPTTFRFNQLDDPLDCSVKLMSH